MSYDDIDEIAYGRLGLKYQDLDYLSMRELTSAHNGFIKKQKEEWAVWRRMIHPIVQIHTKKQISLDQILPIDFDNKPKEIKLSTVTKLDGKNGKS